MAADKFYKFVVRDSSGKVSEAWARGKKTKEQIKEIFIQQQKLGNMPVGEIVSMELSSNPKMPTGTVKTTITHKDGKEEQKEIPVTSVIRSLEARLNAANKKPGT